jgi:hypothetical protein
MPAGPLTAATIIPWCPIDRLGSRIQQQMAFEEKTSNYGLLFRCARVRNNLRSYDRDDTPMIEIFIPDSSGP